MMTADTGIFVYDLENAVNHRDEFSPSDQIAYVTAKLDALTEIPEGDDFENLLHLASIIGILPENAGEGDITQDQCEQLSESASNLLERLGIPDNEDDSLWANFQGMAYAAAEAFVLRSSYNEQI